MNPKDRNANNPKDRNANHAAAEPFPPGVAATLAEADRSLQALAGGGHHALYQAARLWAARIAPADAFYVGFYAPGRAVSFPYSFDGQEYDDPAAIPYGPDGLSAWMLTNRRPYWSREDGGRLLRRGPRFGDTGQLSEEVVVAPIFETPVFDDPSPDGSPPPAVIGLMSMQSYAPGSYDATTVRAFAFLAGSLAAVLAREREDGRRLAALGASPAPSNSVADAVAARLGALGRGLEAVGRLVPEGAAELAGAVAALRGEYERAQTEVAEMLSGAGPARRGDPLAGLTPRQREVAPLLAEGLSVREIAARLFLSEHTVRDHRRALLGWLGSSGRSELAGRLRRTLAPQD